MVRKEIFFAFIAHNIMRPPKAAAGCCIGTTLGWEGHTSNLSGLCLAGSSRVTETGVMHLSVWHAARRHVLDVHRQATAAGEVDEETLNPLARRLIAPYEE